MSTSETPRTDALFDKYHRAAGYMLMTTREQMLMDEYKQLERELAAAKADSERLDWLEKHDAETFSDCGFGDGESRWSCTWARGNVNDRQHESTTGHDSIRAAIDAARKETSP